MAVFAVVMIVSVAALTVTTVAVQPGSVLPVGQLLPAVVEVMVLTSAWSLVSGLLMVMV